MKKIMLLLCACLCCGCGAVQQAIKHPAVSEYVGDINLEAFTDINKLFEIGADATGKAVFKDPQAAFEAFKSQYHDEIEAIQNQFQLEDLTLDNLEAYKNYGWQLKDDALREGGQFVTEFLDIFENSY